MQEHLLGNMRDHLATLNEIIGDVANDNFDDAAKITEQRQDNTANSFVIEIVHNS
jgi:c-di-AMP phosphodiesterase-like protein